MFTKLLSNNFKISLLVLALFFLVTFPAYKDLLKTGMISGQDTEGHLVRLIEFDNALKDGSIPVRWSKKLNFGLGYPYFMFDSPGAYYITDFVYILRGSYVNSIKIIFLLSFPLSGFFTYIWLKNHFDKISALSGGLFATLVPYHFLNVYVRGDLAEVIGLTLVPLIFYLIDKLLSRKRLIDAFIFGLVFGLLIISHSLTALVFAVIFTCYGYLIIIAGRKFELLKLFSVSLAWGVVLSSFFLVPAMVYKRDTFLDARLTGYYIQNFPSFKSLVYSPWGFGNSKSGPGEMSFQIGIMQEVVIALSAILLSLSLKFKKLRNKFALFGLVIVIVSTFLMQEVSRGIWDRIHILQFMQFPWRFLGVVALACAILAAYLSSLIKSYYKFVCLILVIIGLLFLNKNFWHVNKYYTWYDYWSQDGYLGTTTIANEQTPIWQISDEQFLPHITYRKISGDFQIKDLAWRTNLHAFSVNATKQSVIVDRTDYFPGWYVFIDGKREDMIDQNNPLMRGLIGINIPPGNHLVETKLLETPLEKISDAISLLALISGLLLFFKSKKWLKK